MTEFATSAVAAPRKRGRGPTGPDPSRPAPPLPSGPVVPVRMRVIAWIMLTMTIVLAAVVLTVRNAMLSDVARQANADVVQEVEELREFISEGLDPETARPFTSTGDLLEVYLRRQRAGEGEVLLGYLRGSDEVVTSRQPAGDRPDPHDLAADGDVLRPIIDGTVSSGVALTTAGEMRWGRVTVSTGRPDDAGGALVVAEFTAGAAAAVDRTVRLILTVGLGSLLVVAAIAWLVAGQILRPVRMVRRAAAEITERDMTRRIPVQGRDDIAALATTFNGMLDRLEDAFATQRTFVDDAGHELRTPITIIRGHLELLGDDPKDLRTTIRLVLNELDRMNRIVLDLLVLAKAERPDFVREELVDVAELTLEIDAKVQTLADRHWTLAHVADGSARLDAQRVTQAVLQLAQNAVQHTAVGTEIRLASTFRERPTGMLVEFSVTDRGPGLRPGELEAIFERFAHGTADRHQGERAGAGLGLAIVRAIAEAHDGAAFVRSTYGAGATFGIVVPARELRRHAPSDLPAGAATSSIGAPPRGSIGPDHR